MATYGPGIDQSQHAKSVSHFHLSPLSNKIFYSAIIIKSRGFQSLLSCTLFCTDDENDNSWGNPIKKSFVN